MSEPNRANPDPAHPADEPRPGDTRYLGDAASSPDVTRPGGAPHATVDPLLGTPVYVGNVSRGDYAEDDATWPGKPAYPGDASRAGEAGYPGGDSWSGDTMYLGDTMGSPDAERPGGAPHAAADPGPPGRPAHPGDAPGGDYAEDDPTWPGRPAYPGEASRAGEAGYPGGDSWSGDTMYLGDTMASPEVTQPGGAPHATAADPAAPGGAPHAAEPEFSGGVGYPDEPPAAGRPAYSGSDPEWSRDTVRLREPAGARDGVGSAGEIGYPENAATADYSGTAPAWSGEPAYPETYPESAPRPADPGYSGGVPYSDEPPAAKQAGYAEGDSGWSGETMYLGDATVTREVRPPEDVPPAAEAGYSGEAAYAESAPREDAGYATEPATSAGRFTIVERPEMLVVGYAARTTPAAEADPSRAQLPALWQRAGAPGAFAHVPARVDENLYAVLTDYESDHRGAYTQIVGIAVHTAARLPEGMVAVRVPGVPVMKLEARGPMPQALIEAWQQVWQHTESGAAPTRAFTTDVEVHHAEGADLYIAIFPPAS